MPVIAELEDEHIWLSTEWRHKELTKSLPGVKWDSPREQWRIPVSWSGCLALRSTYRHELEIGPALADWAWHEKQERIDPCLELRDKIDWEGDQDLYGWQRSGVEFIKRGKQVLIADDPGAGKTATAIRGLAKLYSEGNNVFPILVVCPNSMKKTWAREFEMWWPGIVCSVVKGSATARRKALKVPAHVYIINWESLRGHSRLAPYGSIGLKKCLDHGGEDPKVSENTCEVHKRELNAFEFGAIVADEIHRAKDPQSKQTRALWAASGKTEIRIALTGTPIANSVIDLWPILHWLAPDEWPGKTKWVDRFLDTMLNAWQSLIVLGIKPGMQDEFFASINPRFRRMPEELVLDFLPPIIYQLRECEMSAKQKKAYTQMQDEMVAELESGLVAAGDPLQKSLRLLQLASSYGDVKTIQVPVRDPDTGDIVLDPMTGEPMTKAKQKVILSDPSSKVDQFMVDVPDFAGHQVAVMAVSRQLIELLSARLEKAKIPHGLVTGAQDEDERQKHMDDFQEGKTQFILFTAGAGGTGITLTAARYFVRFQRPWSLVDDKQTLRRVRRIGSERHDNIFVIDYVTEGTIEDKVVEALDVKNVSFQDVVRDNDLLLRVIKNED